MAEIVGGEMTQLLEKARNGDHAARDSVILFLCDQLRGTAEILMRHESAGHSLQPTALLHDALIQLDEAKLFDQAENIRYLKGAMRRALKQVLVNHARAKLARKRGGMQTRLPLDVVCDTVEEDLGYGLVELDDVIQALRVNFPRPALVVDFKVFQGMTVNEIAVELNISISTVEEDWRFASAWLRRQISKGLDGDHLKS